MLRVAIKDDAYTVSGEMTFHASGQESEQSRTYRVSDAGSIRDGRACATPEMQSRPYLGMQLTRIDGGLKVYNRDMQKAYSACRQAVEEEMAKQ